MLKLSIADIKRLALISKVSQEEVSSVEDIALVSLEALAKPILESDNPEAIDAYNKLKSFIEQQKKEAITNPVLEGLDYGASPLVSGDVPERYRDNVIERFGQFKEDNPSEMGDEEYKKYLDDLKEKEERQLERYRRFSEEETDPDIKRIVLENYDNPYYYSDTFGPLSRYLVDVPNSLVNIIINSLGLSDDADKRVKHQVLRIVKEIRKNKELNVGKEMIKGSSLLSSPYDSGFYVGMNTDLNEEVGWETYIDNMTELPTSKIGITEEDKIEFEKGFTEGRWSRGYGDQIRISMKKKATIVKKDDGWYVESKEKKNLGGPYKSKEKAEERLRQVEYFKKKEGAVENLPHIWEVTNEEFDELLTDPNSDPTIFERSERYFQEGGERFDTTEQWESWREKEFPGLGREVEQYKDIIQFYKNEVADLVGRDPEWIDTGSLKFYREESIYNAARREYDIPDEVMNEYPALQHALTYSEEFIEQMKEVMKEFYYGDPDFPIGELNIGDYLIVKEYQPVLSKVFHKTQSFTTVEYIYNLKAGYVEGKKRIKNRNKQGQDYLVFTISDDVLEYLLGAVLKKEGEKVGGDMKKLAYLDSENFEGPTRVIVTDSISKYYRQEVIVEKFMRGGRKSGKFKCILVEEGGITAYFRPDQLTTYADLIEEPEEEIEPIQPIISDPPIAFYNFEREGNNVLVSDGKSKYLVEKNASYYDELELNKVYSDEEIEYHIETRLWGKVGNKIMYECPECGKVFEEDEIKEKRDWRGWITFHCPSCGSESFEEIKKEEGQEKLSDINVTPIIEWKVGKKLEGYLLFEEPGYFVTLVRLEDLGDTSDDYDSIDHKTYRDEHLTNLAKDSFAAMGFKEYIARVPVDIGFKTEQEISMDEEMRSLREKLLGDVAKREEK